MKILELNTQKSQQKFQDIKDKMRKIKFYYNIIMKKIIIKNKTRKMGGCIERNARRKERQEKIYAEKMNIINGMKTSWILEEILPPTEEEHDLFFLYPRKMSYDYIISIREKYWGNNRVLNK